MECKAFKNLVHKIMDTMSCINWYYLGDYYLH